MNLVPQQPQGCSPGEGNRFTTRCCYISDISPLNIHAQPKLRSSLRYSTGLSERGVCSWKTKACLSVRHEIDEVEKLKAFLSHWSFFIQISNRRRGKSWDVSQIRCDQSELYTTAATVNAVCFLGTSGSGSILVQLLYVYEEERGLKEYVNSSTDEHLCSSVSVPYYESLVDTWASPASFQLLDWPWPSIWKWYQSMSAPAAHVLRNCPPAGLKRARGQAKTKETGEKYEENTEMRWDPYVMKAWLYHGNNVVLTLTQVRGVSQLESSG